MQELKNFYKLQIIILYDFKKVSKKKKWIFWAKYRSLKMLHFLKLFMQYNLKFLILRLIYYTYDIKKLQVTFFFFFLSALQKLWRIDCSCITFLL